MEAEKTKFKIAAQNRLVEEREAHTEREKAKIEAEKVAAVDLINMERRVAEKLGKKDLAKVILPPNPSQPSLSPI